MRKWLAELLSGLPGRRHAPVPTAPGMVHAAPVAAVVQHSVAQFPAPALPADLSAPFIEWQLGGAASRETPMGPRELRALRHLDALLAEERTPADLLPRTPAVVPQLLNLLRQDNLPLSAVCERVGKDVLLTAEVLRLANTTHYRQRAGHAVADLSQAVAALGNDGVQRAIARVVLKPLFDGQGGVLSSRAAAPLWKHGEHKAALCAGLAAQRGIEPFEGYLAGLMHNAGWSIAWRAFDRMDGGVSVPFSHAFVQQLVLRKDRLFGKAAAGWQISTTLNALGADLLEHGLEPARSPLAAVLALADRDTTITMLAPTVAVDLGTSQLLQPAA